MMYAPYTCGGCLQFKERMNKQLERILDVRIISKKCKIRVTAVIAIPDHRWQRAVLQLYGSPSPYRAAFSRDDANLFSNFYVQIGEAHFDATWLRSIRHRQDQRLARIMELHGDLKTAPFVAVLEDAVLQALATVTGKKVCGAPLLCDQSIRERVSVLTCPPNTHSCVYVIKAVLDNMLKFCVPQEAKGRRAFSRHVETPAGMNATGKIRASVSTYRRLIAA